MATHSSILAWRIPMNRGAWQAAVPYGWNIKLCSGVEVFMFYFNHVHYSCSISKLSDSAIP